MATQKNAGAQREPRRQGDDGAREQRNRQDVVERSGQEQAADTNEAQQGTLASGYSSGSSSGGTAGGVLQQRGSGYSPGADSRLGARPEESDELAREGVTAGAAGVADEARAAQLRRGEEREGDDGTEDYDASDGGRAVGGVSGTSGGGSGTTPSNNTRK